jgi:tetratricopeptide (TPR) repeat protein
VVRFRAFRSYNQSADRSLGIEEVHLLLLALASTLWLAGTPAQSQGISREQATQSLSDAEPRARRDAASRLGEVGTMTDVPLLVGALRDPDADTRDQAEQALWRIWGRSGDPEADRLYQTGIEQMNAGDLQQSIVTFTRIIELKPDFAEGWNKRATLYFLVGDLLKSLADCDEVMKRNPYHFGALSGYALIYTRLEYYERALEYSRRALAVNPNMAGVRQNAELLKHLLEQRRGRTI